MKLKLDWVGVLLKRREEKNQENPGRLENEEKLGSSANGKGPLNDISSVEDRRAFLSPSKGKQSTI